MKPRATWREKLERGEARVVTIPAKMKPAWGAGKMLIPRPLDVDVLIRRVPKGRLVTVERLRERLARDAKVRVACPLTTGIFVWLAAGAAEEDRRAGRARVTPWWRVVRPDGRLNPKFPGGAAGHAWKLRAEGHRIERGRVVGFEKALARV